MSYTGIPTSSGDNTSMHYYNTSNVMALNSTLSGVTEPYPRPRVFQSPPLGTQDLVMIPICALVFVLSVVGNLLVIITLIQNKRMRTVTNVFLLNLSVSDLLLAVFCMPFTIVPIMLKNFIFGPVMCVMIRYLQGECNTELIRQSQQKSYAFLVC